MKRGTPILIRRFMCPACGLKLSACKWYEPTPSGHIKTMWCPGCKAQRDFVQYDTDKARV